MVVRAEAGSSQCGCAESGCPFAAATLREASGAGGAGSVAPARTLLTRLGIRKPSVSGVAHPRAARTFSLDDLLKPQPGRKEWSEGEGAAHSATPKPQPQHDQTRTCLRFDRAIERPPRRFRPIDIPHFDREPTRRRR